MMTFLKAATFGTLMMVPFAACAMDYPSPKEGDWIASSFKFHNGAVVHGLRLHYTTVGEPTGEPVLVLHNTGGSAADILTPDFAGELFGLGQPLDATKYYIIIPDAIGAGKSSKPSDGLRTKFPKYDYGDMVEAQHRLVKEGLGIKHLRLVIGNSMGGMHTWLWGEKYPDFMDALVPMAAQPSDMASRNWMLRRMLIESIKRDPDYMNGNYRVQPRSLRIADIFYNIATNGGTLAYQKLAPTSAKADEIIDQRLATTMNADANDFIYQWGSSHDYSALGGLERIKAPLLAINSTDDERNPPETGTMLRDLKRVKNGHLYLIPASEETRGHATTDMAKFYKQQLQEFLLSAPHREN